MTRRGRKIAAVVTAAGLLVAATTTVRLAAFAGAGDDRAGGDAPEASERTAGLDLWSARSRAPRRWAPSPGNAQVDVARVEAALARLSETTARISAEDLAQEQARMLEAKARFEAVEIPEPTTRPFTDQNGTRWIELRHASGEVRYALAPDEPATEAQAEAKAQ
jgi:hypothetical protein